MKNLIVTCLLLAGLFCFTPKVNASHHAGGDIWISINSNNQAIVTITLFRNMESINLPIVASYFYDNLADTAGPLRSVALRVIHDTVFVEPNPMTNNIFGLERYVYVDTINLSSSGTYRFDAEYVLRPPCVNLSGAGFMYVHSEITHTMGVANKGVRFLDNPIYSNNTEQFSITNLADQSDADSVTHEYVIPKISFTQNVPQFSPFFLSSQNPLNVNPVFNSITGQLTTKGYNPISGAYGYAVKATAYRNGLISGYAVRENVFRTYPISSAVSSDIINFSKPPSTLNLGSRGNGYIAQVGTPLTLDSLLFDFPNFGVYSPSSVSDVTVEVVTTSGIQFGTNATLTDSILNTAKTLRNFSLTYIPDASSGNQFEVINFRLVSKYSSYDYSFWIYVEGDSAIKHEGADLTAAKDSAGNTQLSLNLYHGGTTVLDTAQTILVKDAQGNTTTHNVYKDNVQLVRSIPSAVLVSNYSADLGNLAAGTYTAYIQECCRLNNVLNVAQSTANGFYVETQFTIDATTKGAPKFNFAPLTAVPKDSLWGYDISATDLDGDSIYYSVSDPLQAAGVSVNQFVGLPSNSPLNLQVVQSAGVLAISGSTAGKYVLNVKAETFDATGNKRDEINRDMFVEVLDTGASLNIIVPDSSTLNVSTGLPSFSLTAGKPFQFAVSAFTNLVADSTTGLTMQATGMPLTMTNSAASFVVSLNKRGSGKKGTFTWTPDKSLKGQRFIVKVRVEDEQMSYTYTVLLTVDAAVGISENVVRQLEVYPNPAKDKLNINFTEGGNYTIHLINEVGQIVFTKEANVNAGVEMINLPSEFSNGVYVLQIEAADSSYLQKVQILK